MLVLVFALLPGRTRTFAVLVPIAAGIAAAAPAVLHVGDRLSHEQVTHATVHSAAVAMSPPRSPSGWRSRWRRRGEPVTLQRCRGRVRTGLLVVAVATLVAVLAGGLVAAGNPIARIESGWQTFKGGCADGAGGSRLISGLGGDRWACRVALDEASPPAARRRRRQLPAAVPRPRAKR